MDERLRLVVELQNKASAELRKLSKEMDGVKPGAGARATASWFQTLEGASGNATKAMRPLVGGLNMIGAGGLAAGLSVAGLVSQFRDLAKAAPALQELSRQTGISKTELERLKYAGKNLNIDPSKMSAGLAAFSREMIQFSIKSGDLYGEMQNGAAGLAQKIAKEWKDNPEQALKDYLAWLAAIPDAQKAAGKSVQEGVQKQRYFVGKMFGDEDMAQLLSKGMGGFNAAMDDAQKNVAEITDDYIAQAQKFNESINAFDQSWHSFETTVGPTVFKNLTKATDDFREVFKEVEDAVTWFDRHKDHPIQDAAKATLDATDAQSAKNKANPSGIILDLPSVASDVIHNAIGDRRPVVQPWDNNSGLPGLDNETPASDSRPLTLRAPAPVPTAFRVPDAYNREMRARSGGDGQDHTLDGVVVGALERPILHLSGTLKSAAGVIADGIHPAAFHPTGLGGGSTIDAQGLITAGVKEGVLSAYRELAGLSDVGGGGLTPAAFHGGSMPGGYSASAAGRPNMRYGAGGHSPSAAAEGGEGGTRSWRNNNPGNITMGKWASAHGADGSDGRFAHFPTYAAGRKAQEDLWFNSDTYRGLTLAQAVGKWSPPSENDTAGIVRAYAGAVGMSPDTPLSQLTPEQRGKLLDTQQAREGWHEGARRNGVAAPSASAGPRGTYPDWMDDKSKREMAGINSPLARDLIAASEATGTHFRILQGLRTQAEADHNAFTGRGVRNSQHLYGAAADIKLTDAQGRDLDRSGYANFAQVFQAYSRAHSGNSRWLGGIGGRWSSDIAHFDQGIGYGQSHARDPYGAGGPTAADIAAGNKEILSGPNNPFLRAAKPLGDVADKLKAVVAPMPAVAPEPPRLDATAGQRASTDPIELNIRHHPNGRTSIAAKSGPGVKISLKTAPTLVQTG